MSALHCRISYRPLRIGWVVEPRPDEIETVFSNAFRLWGGRCSPILSLEDKSRANRLARQFGVDLLCGASGEQAGTELEMQPCLPYPFWGPIVGPGGASEPLDIVNAMWNFEEARSAGRVDPKLILHELVWDDDDPLRLAFAGMFGKLRDDETANVIKEVLRPQSLNLSQKSEVPLAALRGSVLRLLSGWDLSPGRRVDAGVFVGDANDVTDLVEYWNLKASGARVIFYDPRHEQRLKGLVRLIAEDVSKTWERPGFPGNRFVIWSRTRDYPADLLGPEIEHVHSAPWHGGREPEYPMFSTVFDVAHPTESGASAGLVVGLRSRPACRDRAGRQHLVASMNFTSALEGLETTLRPPFFPALNEYYGRTLCGRPDVFRVEPEGFGVIVSSDSEYVTLWPAQQVEVVHRLLSRCGLESEPSQAGRLARRLLSQMGGLQACRVFKIEGVRQLVAEHSGRATFTRSGANMTIGGVRDGRPQFERYEDLCIEARTESKLSPAQVLDFLLRKGVFQVGLHTRCPNCELVDWLKIDALATIATCAFCEHRYHLAPQLKDRDWAYRCSGLFQHFERQEGAIPVVLTLQQLDTHYREGTAAIGTCLNLRSSALGLKCESDFIWIVNRGREVPAIVIGECKDQLGIDSSDAQNLRRVADQLEKWGFDVFIVFSKLAPFTDLDRANCRLAQPAEACRVIMLGPAQLEPYELEYDTSRWRTHWRVKGLEGLAIATAETHLAFASSGGRPHAEQPPVQDSVGETEPTG